MNRFLIAIRFLTIIPVNGPSKKDEAPVRGLAFFPLVGLLQGGILALTAFISLRLFPDSIVPALVLIVYVLSNGGFHLDGLSDTFDGIAKRGDRQRKLDAMKDSKAGAIGVAAIVFSVLIKYLSIDEIEGSLFYPSIILMPVFSKWVMIISMLYGKPAREDGLGRMFMNDIKKGSVLAATLFTAGSAAFFLLALPPREAAVLSLSVMAALYILSRLLDRLFASQFGGLTGDTLGASGELSEIIFLLTVLIWQRHYIL